METKLRIQKDQIYVAWQSGAADVDGQISWQRGARLRGDHPAVKYMGAAAFVPDGTPESEWPNVRDGIIEAAEREAETKAKAAAKVLAANPPTFTDRTPIGDLVQCVQGILASKAGSCPEGVVLPASDPRVVLVPQAFKPLLERLTIE